MLQFDQPRRIVSVSDDGGYACVEGSNTGLPMAELTVVEPPSEEKGKQPPAPPGGVSTLWLVLRERQQRCAPIPGHYLESSALP